MGYLSTGCSKGYKDTSLRYMHFLVTQVGKNRPYVLRDIKRICKILKFKMKAELLGGVLAI